MGRQINRLTWPFVKSASEGRHADGLGLYLLNDGTKRWIFMFQWGGSRREMGLGSILEVDLKEARRLRDEMRDLVRRGINPIEARKTAKQETAPATFRDFVKTVMADKGEEWAEGKTAAAWNRTFTALNGGDPYAAPLLDLPLAQVDTEAVLKVLRPIWLEKPETALKVRGHIEAVLDAATAKGLRSGANPAAWKGHLKTLLPVQPKLVRGHHRALPYQDLPAVWQRLMAMDGVAPKALAWTILTAARETMTLEADLKEIDRATKTWTIPKERMKGRVDQRQEHRVPLTDAALAILDSVGATKGCAFPGPISGGPLSNAAMDAVCKRLGIDATPHGFRSTFRDWAGDCTSFPEEIAEAALAHVVGSKVRRAYRRGDAFMKRRELMEAWTKFVTTPPVQKVVDHPRRASVS
jgi:integrase